MFRSRFQLGLIHMAVAMTLVPINSTLNRVMIKELALSATLVAIMASLPYLFSPIQVAIGSFSDRHPIFGWRRSPYIALGLVLTVAGVIFSPQVAFLLAENRWLGLGLGVLVFGAWGMGFNFATVSYFSLASEISGEKGRSRTIAIMFFMMISGIIGTSIGLGRLLEPYSPALLERAFQIVGLVALILGGIGLLGLEPRVSKEQVFVGEVRYGLGSLIQIVFGNRQVTLFFWYLILLLAAILGQDILLEPFAGEAFGLPVEATTRITSIWGICVLLSLLVTGLLEGRVSKLGVVKIGAVAAIIAFITIAISGMIISKNLFYAGVLALGLATGISTVSNLSLMLDMTVAGKVGLFMGAWGMANALSRLTGSILSGFVRDSISQVAHSPVTGYVVVFGIEAALLVISLALLRRINVNLFQHQAKQVSVIERGAIASEAG
jgi:BCD family chlorophyll transporter-like MFS transporter